VSVEITGLATEPAGPVLNPRWINAPPTGSRPAGARGFPAITPDRDKPADFIALSDHGTDFK
jgi:hypothetical protein